MLPMNAPTAIGLSSSETTRAAWRTKDDDSIEGSRFVYPARRDLWVWTLRESRSETRMNHAACRIACGVLSKARYRSQGVRSENLFYAPGLVLNFLGLGHLL